MQGCVKEGEDANLSAKLYQSCGKKQASDKRIEMKVQLCSRCDADLTWYNVRCGLVAGSLNDNSNFHLSCTKVENGAELLRRRLPKGDVRLGASVFGKYSERHMAI